MNVNLKISPASPAMIELSTSWELQGRGKLSDVLVIKELQLDKAQTNNGVDVSSMKEDAPEDVSPHSSPITLQPYLHPELSPSPGACCILIRLSTSRRLRIIQLVIVSSSPHVDFVDRYGEPLAHIEGVSTGSGTFDAGPAGKPLGSLYRCFSGRLSPHIECVVRFSEATHLSDLLVIQHIGVFTSLASSSEGFADAAETHTQEIIKLSSFLGGSSNSSLGVGGGGLASASANTSRSHNRITLSTPVAIRSKATCPIMDAGPNISSVANPSFETLSANFLTSAFPRQPVEFWQRCAVSLFANLVRLSVAGVEMSEKAYRGSGNVDADEIERNVRCMGSELTAKLQADILADPPIQLAHPTTEQLISSICQLSSNVRNLQQICQAHFGDLFDRVRRLELQKPKNGDLGNLVDDLNVSNSALDQIPKKSSIPAPNDKTDSA